MLTLRELFLQQSKNNQKIWNSSNFLVQNYMSYVPIGSTSNGGVTKNQ